MLLCSLLVRRLLTLLAVLGIGLACDSLVSEGMAADERVPAAQVSGISQKQLGQVRQWIEQLGADEFAVRERAASQLVEVGLPVLPLLREAFAETRDPEKRLRAEQLMRQLKAGDLQIKIDRFLAGNEVSFQGWEQTQGVMGDSLGVRQLFVELMVAHPEVAMSLAGTPRDQYVAMEVAVGRVETRMHEQLKAPTRADAIALLLPARDPKVPVSEAVEGLMLTVLNQAAANMLHKDVQVGGPFDEVVADWINRSSVNNRAEVLFFAQEWRLARVLPLARQTLSEASAVQSLGIAMQYIAVFGSPQDGELVAPFLEDSRVLSEQGGYGVDPVETHLQDVAMATIAMLNKVKLDAIGFEGATPHPLRGFVFEEIGFAASKSLKRNEIRQRVKKRLEGDLPSEQ
ncbi:hypothetical protein [Novipirellula artificiosorum]|nr:hypothetical protein [Novipirellula artificiosorum]